MGWRTRSFVSLVLVFFLAGTVTPAGAWGAVTLTWERNIGTYDSAAPWDDGGFHGPTDVAVDKWGNIYVADGWQGPDRIQMFTATGAFVKKYDNPGTDPQQLSDPRSIVTDRWGTIYVTQQGNARIEVFNPALYNHLRTIVSAPAPSDSVGIAVGLGGTIYNSRQWTDVQVRGRFGDFRTSIAPPHVMGIGVSQDDELYVAVDGTGGDPQNMIGVYRPDLSLKWVWGGSGTVPGQFARPWDVGIDGACNVFVVEYDNHRVQVLSQNGEPLAMVGSLGSGDQQFVNPAGIGVGFDRTVYVADIGNSRISKWNVSVPTRSAQISGTDRIKTAIAAAEKAYPDGAMTVVLATATNWPDALGGAALAGVVKGPLLLTYRDSLPAEVAAEIVKLKARHVYVLGGTAAVSDKVYTDAVKLTIDKSGARLWGSNRYLTANDIAEEVVMLKNMPGGGGYDGTAFVCTGADFPDALAVAPVAAANGWPIFLTEPNRLTPSVEAAMKADGVSHGYLIGGEKALDPAVLSRLNTVFRPGGVSGFGRIAGDNRYETAAKVADQAFDGMGMLFSRPALATGENFPDALAGGVLQGSDYSPLLLTKTGSLSPEAAGMLTKHKDHVYEIRFLGGDAAIRPPVRTAARALLW